MEKARVAWGCDAPAAAAVFTVTCSSCNGGLGLSPEETCPTCNGEGEVEFHRCPNAVRREHAGAGVTWLDAALRAYVQFDTRNVMPGGGGYSDQTALFGAVVDIIDAERGRLETMLHAKRQRERELAEKRAQRDAQGGGNVHRPNFRKH